MKNTTVQTLMYVEYMPRVESGTSFSQLRWVTADDETSPVPTTLLQLWAIAAQLHCCLKDFSAFCENTHQRGPSELVWTHRSNNVWAILIILHSKNGKTIYYECFSPAHSSVSDLVLHIVESKKKKARTLKVCEYNQGQTSRTNSTGRYSRNLILSRSILPL